MTSLRMGAPFGGSSVDRLESALDASDRIPGARIGVVGDLMADVYVSVQSDRVSREAPVLILRYEREWLLPGGAANVAANVAALGATAVVVGIVGEDGCGGRLLDALSTSLATPVCCEHVVTAGGRETITKTRFLAGAKRTSRKQVLRLDRHSTAPMPPGLQARVREGVVAADTNVDAWVVSDYGYGFCDDELVDVLRDIAKRKPVVVDSRRNLERFTGMTVVKPNADEAERTARAVGVDVRGPAALAPALASRLESRAAVITLGNQGMVLAIDDRLIRIAAVGTGEIVDLTGAGDTVAAVLTTALAVDSDVETACRLANQAAGIVVMKEGTATASLDEVRAAIRAP